MPGPVCPVFLTLPWCSGCTHAGATRVSAGLCRTVPDSARLCLAQDVSRAWVGFAWSHCKDSYHLPYWYGILTLAKNHETKSIQLQQGYFWQIVEWMLLVCRISYCVRKPKLLKFYSSYMKNINSNCYIFENHSEISLTLPWVINHRKNKLIIIYFYFFFIGGNIYWGHSLLKY